LMRMMSPLTRRSWEPANNRYRSSWADRLEIMAAVLGAELEAQRMLVVAFHEAGVTLLAGSDAPLTFVFPGWSLVRELELFVECGLSPYEALRTATILPTRELGVEASCGTVEVGKQADLLLVAGDPSQELAALKAVDGVFTRGRWLSATDIAARMTALEAAQDVLAKQLDALEPLLASGDVWEVLAALQDMRDADRALVAYVEDELNTLGYARLNSGEGDAAVDVFMAIVDAFPESFNAWDSLGECHMRNGDLTAAIRCYERSLELNPNNENGRQMLARMKR